RRRPAVPAARRRRRSGPARRPGRPGTRWWGRGPPLPWLRGEAGTARGWGPSLLLRWSCARGSLRARRCQGHSRRSAAATRVAGEVGPRADLLSGRVQAGGGQRLGALRERGHDPEGEREPLLAEGRDLDRGAPLPLEP